MEMLVKIFGKIGVAVAQPRVSAVEGIDKSLRVIGKEILEQFSEMNGEIIMVDVTNDLRYEVDKDPFWDMFVSDGIFEIFANDSMI